MHQWWNGEASMIATSAGSAAFQANREENLTVNGQNRHLYHVGITSVLRRCFAPKSERLTERAVGRGEIQVPPVFKPMWQTPTLGA